RREAAARAGLARHPAKARDAQRTRAGARGLTYLGRGQVGTDGTPLSQSPLRARAREAYRSGVPCVPMRPQRVSAGANLRSPDGRSLSPSRRLAKLASLALGLLILCASKTLGVISTCANVSEKCPST